MPKSHPTTEQRVPLEQVLKATGAVLLHHERAAEASTGAADADKASSKSALPLFELDHESVFVTFTLFRMLEKPKHKPLIIPVPHSLWGEDASVCLFVADPASKWVDALREEPVQNITDVIGYTRLRTDFHEFAQRRKLLAAHDAFLVDDRIWPMMPRILGSTFYRRKRQPMPVRISGAKSWHNKLEAARNSTSAIFSSGNCVSARIGHTGMSATELANNSMAVIGRFADFIPSKWRNIQNIMIKSERSPALPIYAGVQAAAVAALAAGAGAKSKPEQAAGAAAADKKKKQQSKSGFNDDAFMAGAAADASEDAQGGEAASDAEEDSAPAAPSPAAAGTKRRARGAAAKSAKAAPAARNAGTKRTRSRK